MSNGEVCCILGVCCPPGSDAQRQALVHEVQKKHPHVSAEKAVEAADAVLKAHDNFEDVAALFDAAIA